MGELFDGGNLRESRYPERMILIDPNRPEYPCVEGGGVHPCQTVGLCVTTEGRTLQRCKLCEEVYIRAEDGHFWMVSETADD